MNKQHLLKFQLPMIVVGLFIILGWAIDVSAIRVELMKLRAEAEEAQSQRQALTAEQNELMDIIQSTHIQY